MYHLDDDGMIRFSQEREQEITDRTRAFAAEMVAEIESGKLTARDALLQMSGYSRGCMNSAVKAEVPMRGEARQ